VLRGLLVAGGLVASSICVMPAHAAPSAACHFATSPKDNSWPSGFVGPAGSAASGNLDIVSLDLSSDAKQITVRIGVRDLNQHDPVGAVGVQYDVRGDIATKRIHLDAAIQAVGNEFYGFVENLGEASGQPEQVQTPGTNTNLTGKLDPGTSTITITAPLTALQLNFPLRVGRERALKNWYVASYRMAGTRTSGGVDFPGDHAGTKRQYAIGEHPCGVIAPV
jgi:hypothetical protein